MKKILRTSTLFLFFTLFIAEIQAQTQLTNLPTLRITTNGGAPISSKETWVQGNLTIAAPGGTIGAYNGAIEIRGRGNSTWNNPPDGPGFPKKPYRIRLASKYQLLGMPAKERNWVLLANYADKTLMRNALAFEISKFLGLPYSAPYRFVDVYLNNEYVGNYLLTDHIQVADKRVEIEEQDETDTQEPAVTGGYLIEADGFADNEPSKFYTSRGMKFTIKSPEDDKINPQQTAYISNFFQMIENKLFSPTFQDPQTGYMKNMDQASLVNWYLACEITGNSDSFWSTYMFKKRNNEKIFFGPLWDYDIAFNNDERLGDATYKRMSTNAHFPAHRVWIERMLLDANFKAALAQRWKQLKAAGLVNHINSLITSMKTTLNQSQAKNFQKWPILNNKVYLEYKYTGTYDEHVEFMRTYLQKRLAWLELQITGELGVDTYYKIVNKHSGKAVAPTSNNQALVQQTYQSSNYRHHWGLSITEAGGIKYYTLTNRATGARILSPNDVSQSQLTLSTAALNSRQQWRLYPYWDNIHFGLVNRANGQAMDNYFGLNAEGNMVSQYPANLENNANQLWQIVATDVNLDALPIYTSGFNAEAHQNTIELSWRVYENQDGDYFEIERFTDPKLSEHEIIGTVPLTDVGIGNYRFTDQKPNAGNNYYRLKQIDKDGTFNYSRIVKAKISSIAQFSLWPVPTISTANVSFSSPQTGKGSLEIYNVLGAKMQTIPLDIQEGKNNYTFDVKNFSQGLYLMKLKYAEETSTIKLLKISN